MYYVHYITLLIIYKFKVTSTLILQALILTDSR